MAKKKYRFKAKVELDNSEMHWMQVWFPFDAEKTFGRRWENLPRKIFIRGTVNGEPFKANMKKQEVEPEFYDVGLRPEPGRYWIYINKSMREATPIRPRQIIDLEFERYEPPPPKKRKPAAKK
jgi:hypothetical protein